MIKEWFKSGAPWIWLNAAAVSTSVILVVGLLGLIAVRGMGHFWPGDVYQFDYEKNGQKQTFIGEWIDSTVMNAQMAKESGYQINPGQETLTQYLLKTGNRDVTGMDFRWIEKHHIVAQATPEDLIAIERREWGNFYGRLKALKNQGQVIAEGEAAWSDVQEKLIEVLALFDEIEHLQKSEIGSINYQMERLRLKQRKLELEGEWNEQAKAEQEQEKSNLNEQYALLQKQLLDLNQKIKRYSLVAEVDNGRQVEINLASIVHVIRPNAMGLFAKMKHYGVKAIEFVMDDPREANTEGGIFPAIFGTVMMVMIMAVLVTPFGVIAAVYLREYAKQGFLTRTIRIAVNNLAGVPSIVYGVFGLGFFVYILGGNIDALFYPEAAPAPVFGTPGLLWASLTLALLSLPVVIVSTEEGLSRVPKSIREGSLALGATKAETLWKTVLPMASPAMMTGLILAVARAAGEVAPLMLVGVVKLAPTLPLDGNFPFLHLDRKFMHLGFHIYDVGFQSPNVEAARPLVYATSLLLVIVIIALNMFAIHIRNNLREKFRALEGL